MEGVNDIQYRLREGKILRFMTQHQTYWVDFDSIDQIEGATVEGVDEHLYLLFTMNKYDCCVYDGSFVDNSNTEKQL